MNRRKPSELASPLAALMNAASAPEAVRCGEMRTSPDSAGFTPEACVSSCAPSRPVSAVAAGSIGTGVMPLQADVNDNCKFSLENSCSELAEQRIDVALREDAQTPQQGLTAVADLRFRDLALADPSSLPDAALSPACSCLAPIAGPIPVHVPLQKPVWSHRLCRALGCKDW